MENAVPVKTLLSPQGISLSKLDSPDITDPALQRRYHMILCFTCFLVQMTRPDLVFAYAELSKFLSCPGSKQLRSRPSACSATCAVRRTKASPTAIQAPPNARVTCSWAGSTRTSQPTPTLPGL
eukprot:1299972-Rhodomonas_salina.5